MNKSIEKLFEKIESVGWTIESDGDNSYRLGKYSPAGQDFGISVEGESAEEIIDSIQEAHNDFDVSEETYLWLDDTGHGRNGAPYHMKDVLEDMEACKQMILDLYNELQ